MRRANCFNANNETHSYRAPERRRIDIEHSPRKRLLAQEIRKIFWKQLDDGRKQCACGAVNVFHFEQPAQNGVATIEKDGG